MQVKAKKHLGQHFLTDLNIAKRISDALELETEMPVLEVGPGMGVLTQFLLQNEKYNTSVVEIDHESVEYLRIHYPQLNIIEGDFLRLKLEELYDKPFCVIGNFPYNISSQIPICVGMIQKEVAERLAEPPGSKTYGILSVLLQAYYDIEYLFTVHEHVFNPPPKVKSAVIRMKRNNRTSLDCDERLFTTVVKTAFNQRRKQLRNSLKILIPKDSTLFSLPIMDERPERLSVDQFIELTQQIANVK